MSFKIAERIIELLPVNRKYGLFAVRGNSTDETMGRCAHTRACVRICVFDASRT